MRTSAVILAGCLAWLAHAAPARAQYGSASHTVRVEVDAVAALVVTAGAVDLTLDAPQIDWTSSSLTGFDQSSAVVWRVNSRDRKITVQTNLAAPRYELWIQAVGPTRGTAAPAARLRTTAVDFLTDIGRTDGFANIRYAGVARFDQPPGQEAHRVTFTIVQQ